MYIRTVHYTVYDFAPSLLQFAAWGIFLAVHICLELNPTIIFSEKGYAPQRYYTENSKHIFPEKELRGHSPNFYIPVSVCDLNIPKTGLHILKQENRPRSSFSGNT